MKHSSEPWSIRFFERENIAKVSSSDGIRLFMIDFNFSGSFKKQHVPDATRFVAAVNAVTGIPTEMLEDGTVAELLEACKWMAQDYYCRMNPAQMPAMAKKAFELWTQIEEAKAK